MNERYEPLLAEVSRLQQDAYQRGLKDAKVASYHEARKYMEAMVHPAAPRQQLLNEYLINVASDLHPDKFQRSNDVLLVMPDAKEEYNKRVRNGRERADREIWETEQW